MPVREYPRALSCWAILELQVCLQKQPFLISFIDVSMENFLIVDEDSIEKRFPGKKWKW